MSKPIELSREARQIIAGRLRKLLDDELDVEIGALEAEILLDRITQDIGAIFYNLALTDARAVAAAKAEDIDDALHALARQSVLR